MNRNEENNKIRSVLADTYASLISELCYCPSVVSINIEVNKVAGLINSEKTFCIEIRMPNKEVVIRESPTPKEHNLNENNNGRKEFDPDRDAHG